MRRLALPLPIVLCWLLLACPPVTSGIIDGKPPRTTVDTSVGAGDVLEIRVYGE